MKRTAIILVAASVALGPALTAQEKQADPAAKGVAALQGTWAILTINGQSLADSGTTMLFAITGDKYAQTVNGEVNERGTIKVDQTKKPMTMHFTIAEGSDAGKPQVGLVEVTGDTMTMKLSQPGGATLPTSMAAEEGFFIVTAKKNK